MIPVSSSADWKIARSPFRLSSFVCAIASSAPSQFSSSFVRFSHSVEPSSSVVFRPDMRSFRASTCCFPPIAARAAFRCSSVHPASAVFRVSSVAFNPMNFPSESNADIPRDFIISPACPVPVVRFAMIAFNAFPASLPLIPLFARTPRAVADSVSGTFRFVITPPTPKYASINCSAVWFDLLFAFAQISRYPARLSTLTPQADILSVTRSDVRARSSPVASDSRRTLGNAEIESFTDHPASAMYSRAAELSVAVFDVVLPHSIAAASSFLYSSSVAPAVAAVEDICASNSLPTFTLATPTAPMAAPAAVRDFAASCTLLTPSEPNPSSPFCAP